jgi:phosphatidylserine decarboxylase
MRSYKNKKKLVAFILFIACFLMHSTAHNQKKALPKKTMNNANMSTQKTPSTLSFLYTNSIGKIMRLCLIKSWASALAGWFCNRKVSSWWIPSFVKTYHINMHEAREPLATYKTFNEFFIRKLKPSARPIDNNLDAIISPADGTILVFENISQTMCFPVKECHFNLATFLGGTRLAHAFEGGTLVLLRLAPWDYHRFHFPISCTPSKAQRIKGIYESVNPIAYLCGIQPLTQNERHIMFLKTDSCDPVCMVSVGALFVGAIKETYVAENNYNKGDEAGYFCFGGSTIVLAFKKGSIKLCQEYVHHSQQGKETPIQMGQSIGHRVQKKEACKQ